MRTLPRFSGKFNQNTEHLCRSLHPLLHGFFGVLGRYLIANQYIIRRVVFLQIADDSLEVLGLSIARTANVEFLLYETW